MNDQENTKYVVCISNRGNELSVVKGRLYKLVEREPNDPPSMIRLIDEEGEDYLYPSDWFVAVELPQTAIAALEAA